MGMLADIKLKRGYNGNALLKKVGEVIHWTPEMMGEWFKCAADPIYFIQNYCKIVSLDHGLIPFTLRDYQQELVTALHERRYVCTTWCRQSGKSTGVVGYILWYIIFNQDKTVGLLANKGETAQEIFGRIQLAYTHLPKWLQQGVREWNKRSLELENGSRAIASATSSDAIRGWSFSFIVIDEAAHIRNWDDFFTSVYPTISSGKTTKLALISTPKGLNHFYAIWTDAVEGKNEYYPLKVTWRQVPGRDEEWRQRTLANMGYDQQKFDQEYECTFEGSSGTLISGAKLKALRATRPIAQQNGLSQYVRPIKDHTYVLVADVGEGRGLDHSAFIVIDVTALPYTQVCVFRSNQLTPVDYTEMIYTIARSYNQAYVLVETNGPGGLVIDTLSSGFEYENVIFTETASRMGKKVSGGFGQRVEAGIRTTKTVKAVGCTSMKMLVEGDRLLVIDQHTISELSTFSKKRSSYEAEEGKHDDLAMCLVLFGWLTNQSYFAELTDINTIGALREKTQEQLMDELTPFGIIDTGHSDHEVQESRSSHGDPNDWFRN